MYKICKLTRSVLLTPSIVYLLLPVEADKMASTLNALTEIGTKDPYHNQSVTNDHGRLLSILIKIANNHQHSNLETGLV